MAEKDSYWFRHDASAGRGLKMRKMSHIYSHWGKGIYWDVIEILRDQKEYKFESDDSSLMLLCDLIGCKSESRFISWFKDCLRVGLFECDGKFFKCPPLSKNMVRWETSKSNGSKGGRPVKKPKQKPKNNLDDNLDETIIEQNRIEQNRIEYNKRLSDSFSVLEKIAKDTDTKLDTVKLFLEKFNTLIEARNSEYVNYRKYEDHFINWYLKNKPNQKKQRIVL